MSQDQDNSQTLSVQNPPLTGLDQPVTEPGWTRSYLLLGAHGSESVYPDPDSDYSVTRFLGSAEMQKDWKHSQFQLTYAGGLDLYHGYSASRSYSQVQALNAEERAEWRKVRLQLRNAFSYLPQGEFSGSSFGGSGAVEVGGLGGLLGGGQAGGLFGSEVSASLGVEPRISNASALQVTELVSPRSELTETGAFLLNHFTGHAEGLIDSQETVGEVGYDYQLNRRDQVGVLYAYQNFHFPVPADGTLSADLVHALYGHRVTGRMNLILAAGPQFTFIHSPFLGQTERLTVSARAILDYTLRTTHLTLSYIRYTTGGGGFYAGATTNMARLSLSRPLGRRYDFFAYAGYSHNSRVLPVTALITAPTYQAVYAGAAVRRYLGRYVDIFSSYQYNNFILDGCSTIRLCNEFAVRNEISVGVDWQFRPIRLD